MKVLPCGAYRAKPSRLVEIPKEDGSVRPLAIACVEDKLLQLAVSWILGKIYEPIFLTSSYGFRTGKSCHDRSDPTVLLALGLVRNIHNT